MATTKKTTTKKPTSKKPVARTPAAKRVAAKPKQTIAKKSVSKKTAANEMQSFHVSKDLPSFTTFAITRQTLYWVILVSFIIFAQLWIISLQVEVASLLDAQQAQLTEMR